jgi:hypothetical protein
MHETLKTAPFLDDPVVASNTQSLWSALSLFFCLPPATLLGGVGLQSTRGRFSELHEFDAGVFPTHDIAAPISLLSGLASRMVMRRPGARRAMALARPAMPPPTMTMRNSGEIEVRAGMLWRSAKAS